MKAFEEWMKNNRVYYPVASEQAWKAALEWIYSKLGYSIEHEEIKDMIEKELEGE